MNDTFQIDGNIMCMQGSAPVRFAHHKTLDNAENHRLHINNYIEIYVYISGDHQYIVENALYELKRGDMIIINPREVHKALPISETLYERFYLLISDRVFDGMHVNPLAALLNKPSGTGNLISFPEKNRELVLDMLYQISECFRDGKDDQLRAFSFLLRLLDEINQQLKQGLPTAGSVAHTPELLRNILAYVAENAATIQSETEIASAVGVTPQYLSGYFSKQIGTPLRTYIQAKRIALAKELLYHGMDVTQTCYACGFNDCSYFIRIFKKYVGVTPLAYKQGRTAGTDCNFPENMIGLIRS